MSKIAISDFGGVAPATPARHLANGQAQIANNCFTWKGPLRPIRDTLLLQPLPKAGQHKSIYRFGQDYAGEDNYWFHWPSDVDVVKGFISGDTSERTFYSGDGPPRVTDNTLALTGGTGEYPANSRLLGVPAPTLPPTVAVTGTAETGAVIEDRVYTYTLVNSWSEESVPFSDIPYPTSAEAQVATGQTVTIDIPVPSFPAGNYNITSKRIYRSTVGTIQFVAEIPVNQTIFVDNVLAEDLVEEIPSLNWDHPPAGLKGFTALPNGVIAAFNGLDVYLSEPYRPFAWPEDYQDSVTDKIVGLGSIDTTVVVLTEGVPRFWQGSDPSLMVMVDSDLSQACASKGSIVSMDGQVLYASPDGLCAVSPGGSVIVTQGLYEKEDWQKLNPSSIQGYYYDGRYIGFYDTGSKQGGFVYDRERNSFTLHDIFATGGYNDRRNDSLYLIINNALHKWDAGDKLNYVWKSKKFTLPHETGYSCFRLDAEAYPMTVKIYRNGALFHTRVVTSDKIERLPPGRGRSWEIEISGAEEVFSFEMAQSPTEIAGA